MDAYLALKEFIIGKKFCQYGLYNRLQSRRWALLAERLHSYLVSERSGKKTLLFLGFAADSLLFSLKLFKSDIRCVL